MIVWDSYTEAIVYLLVALGVLGLAMPEWFIVVSRFPFIFPLEPAGSVTPERRKRARLWGGITLFGALLLMLLAPS